MLLTWSLIYIWHELFLTPQIWNWKSFTAFSRIDVVMLWMCIFCMHTMSINFKHLLKYAIILVWFSFLLYACQWTIRLFICFFSLCLFVCIYFIVWITFCTNKSIKLCQIMHLWRLKTKWLCPSHFQPAFHIQIISSGLYGHPNTFFQMQILGGRSFGT